MPIPSMNTLLANYYAMQVAVPAIVVIAYLIFLGVFIFAASYGYQRGIRYVWGVGIPHSQKEYNKLFRKFNAGVGE